MGNTRVQTKPVSLRAKRVAERTPDSRTVRIHDSLNRERVLRSELAKSKETLRILYVAYFAVLAVAVVAWLAR